MKVSFSKSEKTIASILLASIFCLMACVVKPAIASSNAQNHSTEITVTERESNPDETSEDFDEDNSRSKKNKTPGKTNKNDEPKLSIRTHTATIGGKLITYKSIAGYIVLKDYYQQKRKRNEDEASAEKPSSVTVKTKPDKSDESNKGPKALAKIFFIAYVRDDIADRQKRPITFSFNGGPGSSSIWLHMGALGPRRAVLTERGEALPPPYRLEDNNYSWLDETDLVFIDPVSTGFSRTEPGESPRKYHGVEEDIHSVGEFIRLYLTKNGRWTSPKFLIGESYGTTRAAGLSDYLQDRWGIYLNGIVLVSAVLNFETIEFNSGNELPYALYAPSYTAAAWYHKKLAPDLQKLPLLEAIRQSEEFAARDYRAALFEGDRMSAEKKDDIADRLSTLIGLPKKYVVQLNDKVPFDLFDTHLLGDENKLIGRYDSRYTGLRYEPGRDTFEFDPSYEAVVGAFTATFNDYVRRDLHFESDFPYEVLTGDVDPWNWHTAENKYLDVAQDLRKAMIRNPYLKVWVCCGYYDLATPYFASKYTVDQMSLDPSIRKNIRLSYYEAGHMLYVNKPSLIQFKSNFQTFLKDSILPDASAVPNADR